MKKIAILGSTGSVGRQALEVAEELGLEVVMLTGGANVRLLARQAKRFSPSLCMVPEEKNALELKKLLSGDNITVDYSVKAITKAIRECEADVIVHAVAGLAGLDYAIAAAGSSKRLAMANKEAIIAAGDIIYREIAAFGGELIPVDSEHSAIFQCLCQSGCANTRSPSDAAKIKRILLTASGGPFYGWSKKKLLKVTPEMALAHPTWKMGKKITVDCATMMNKGFELIEAVRLFGVAADKVEIIVHRQSIIHSMVEYIDNTVIAQLSKPDMRDAVRYAVTYPERVARADAGLDFYELAGLTFEKPDEDVFPATAIAREALRIGKTAPAALIAADEEAVSSFLSGEIGFCSITDIVENTLSDMTYTAAESLDSIYEASRSARRIARELIKKRYAL